MEDADLLTINEIKHEAANLRYRLETAARACITISGICWDVLGADKELNDSQRMLLDNVRFELRQVGEQAEKLSPAVDHVFEAANRFEKEVL